VASPLGRAAGAPAGEGEAEAWHIGPGPAAKTPLWRIGSWLIGLAAVAVGLRFVVWLLGGPAPFALLVSTWLLVCVLVGALMTVPYGRARVRGAQLYEPPRDALVVLPLKLSTVLFVMIFWRAFVSIGDAVATSVWNFFGRRWIAAHAPPEVDPQYADIQHAIEHDEGWWGRDS
jgi:hypothetical protein